MYSKRERKKADFEILKGTRWKWMYLDKRFEDKGSGYISYRNLIARAMYKMLQEGYSEQECKEIFQNFRNAYNEKKPYVSQNFLQLFYYYSDKLVGALIEDQTEGCYPLMLMFDDRERHVAFDKTLNNLNKNIDKILEVLALQRRKKWSRKSEKRLDEFYD